MANAADRRVAKFEERVKQIEPFQIVLRFVDPAREKLDRVVVLEVQG